MLHEYLHSGLCNPDSSIVVYFNSKSALDKLSFAVKVTGLISFSEGCKADLVCISADGKVSSLFSVDEYSDDEEAPCE